MSHVSINGTEYPVTSEPCKCSGDPGRWVCTKCKIVFPNNLTATNHESYRKHELHWLCFECNTVQEELP